VSECEVVDFMVWLDYFGELIGELDLVGGVSVLLSWIECWYVEV